MSMLIRINALGAGALVNSECSSEAVHLHSLARMFSARIHNINESLPCRAYYVYISMCVGYSPNKSNLILSHIENVHLLFCAHFIIFYYIFGECNLDITYNVRLHHLWCV